MAKGELVIEATIYDEDNQSRVEGQIRLPIAESQNLSRSALDFIDRFVSLFVTPRRELETVTPDPAQPIHDGPDV